MDKTAQHKALCESLNQTYAKKNADYGDAFGKTFASLGIISAVTRISDKYNRLVSLTTKSESERKVKDETIRDTLMDMANYCLMTVLELDKQENSITITAPTPPDNWQAPYIDNPCTPLSVPNLPYTPWQITCDTEATT